jgi:hypothetical protein
LEEYEAEREAARARNAELFSVKIREVATQKIDRERPKRVIERVDHIVVRTTDTRSVGENGGGVSAH